MAALHNNFNRKRRKDHIVAQELKVEIDTEMTLGLTEKQKKFAETYVSQPDWSLSECALHAGYAESVARGQATALLRHPPVTAYVKKLRNELNLKYEVTFESHVRKLAEIRDLALQNGAYAAAVTAEKHRGQVAGLYIDRKEILVGKIDQMSREDVLKEIAKLKQELPELTAIIETNNVIEHQPIVQYEGENGEEAGEQVQQETDRSNEE